MTLWPGADASTATDFLASLPGYAPIDPNCQYTNRTTAARRTLRLVVLDGVYSQASSMFKAMRKRLPSEINPTTVAVHPSTLSVFKRAAKRYARDSAKAVQKSADPLALRVSTVEATALLLKELGESDRVTQALVDAVVVNNQALESSLLVRPAQGLPNSHTSGSAKRKQQRARLEEKRKNDCGCTGATEHLGSL